MLSRTALLIVALVALASAKTMAAQGQQHVCEKLGNPRAECARFDMEPIGKDDYAESVASRDAHLTLVKAGNCVTLYPCAEKGTQLSTFDGKTISHVTYCKTADGSNPCAEPEATAAPTNAPEEEEEETAAPTEAPEEEETAAPTAAPTDAPQEEEETAAPTTATPPTAAPTTATPPTAAPTTAAPATVAPTVLTTVSPHVNETAPCAARPLEVIRKELLCLSKEVTALATAVAKAKVAPAKIAAKLTPYQDNVINSPSESEAAQARLERAARNPDGSLSNDSIGAIVVGSIVGAAIVAALIVAFSVVRKRKATSSMDASNTTPLLQQKGWEVSQ